LFKQFLSRRVYENSEKLLFALLITEISGLFQKSLYFEVNPSTPRPEGQGLLRVDPERRFLTPPSKARLGAVEWVNERRIKR
jgi:hypothetical protein